MKMNKIFIVIPVFNKIAYTRNCLNSLKKQTYKDFEVIVVDDGSQDGTSEVISSQYPEVTLLKGDGNLWWTGGTNKGVEYALQHAKNEAFVLTLNNDLEVEPDYLQQLLEVYAQQKPCLVGSVSVNIHDPEKIAFMGIKWNRITAKSRPVVKEKYTCSQLKEQYEALPTDLLPGRGTLIPVEVFKKVGLFDFEHFPQYVADFDFSRRAYNQGYKLVVSTRAVVKSIVESSGLKYKDHPSFKVFFQSLFSIKSPIWYKIRYHWAIRHSPLKFGYFVISMGRIVISFLREMLIYKVRKA